MNSFFVFNRFYNRSMHRRTQPPFWPCNMVQQLNFPSIIFQTNNSCSLLSLMLAKRLLLDISCENIFALSVVTALPACPFLIKKRAKLSVFYAKTVKIRWRLGVLPQTLGCAPPPPALAKSWVRLWVYV